MLGDGRRTETLANLPDDTRKRLSSLFSGMMQAMFNQKGATFSVDIVADPAAREFIEAHTATLDESFSKVDMSEKMRRRLSRSNYIFSGMKTFHELHEAFPSMFDENGNRKSFERFLKDVRSIDQTYNVNYLRAEYNFVNASARAAAKWESFAEDGDRYNLQYRTQSDDKVRPEHAALNRVTLPPSDPFWEEFYPPNGWNCRCSVVQVLKSRYPTTPHDEAMGLGEMALQRDTKGIFRFNPGKQEKAIPDYNPYTIRRCRDCDIAQGNSGKLVASIPDSELCQACRIVREMQDYYSEIPVSNGKVRIHTTHGVAEAKENISIARYLAEKYGYSIDLLPNPDNQKSADSYNHTLGYEQEYKVNSTPTKSAIDKELRKAARQASHIVLRIDSSISLEELTRGIRGRVSQSDIQEVTIIWGGKDIALSRETILSDDFKMQQEDFA